MQFCFACPDSFSSASMISFVTQNKGIRAALQALPLDPRLIISQISNTVPEPRKNEGPRDWQNMFAITRFLCN